jgi:hypothetical protein
LEFTQKNAAEGEDGKIDEGRVTVPAGLRHEDSFLDEGVSRDFEQFQKKEKTDEKWKNHMETNDYGAGGGSARWRDGGCISGAGAGSR